MVKPKATFLILCFFAFRGNSARGDELLGRFQREYVAASQKLDDLYSHARATGTLASTDDDGDFRCKVSFEHNRGGKAILELRTYIESAVPQAPAGTVYACGGTAKNFFEIYRTAPGQGFIIKWFGPRDDFNEFSKFNLAPLYAPCCFDGSRISDYLSSQAWTFKSAQMDVLDGKSVARVDFAASLSPGKVLQGSVYFLLPMWAVAGWHSSLGRAEIPVGRTDENLSTEGRITYSSLEPSPKVLKVQRWRVRPTKRTDEMTFDIGKLEFVDVPEDRFQVMSFGLKEPPKMITPGQK